MIKAEDGRQGREYLDNIGGKENSRRPLVARACLVPLVEEDKRDLGRL